MTTAARTLLLLGLPFGLAWGCSVGDAPAFAAPLRLGGVEVSAEVLNHGRGVYFRHCASCHGPDGSGAGPAARALATAPRDFRTATFVHKSTPGDQLPTDDDLDLTIRRGLVETGMPAWTGMPDRDRHAVIQFIKTLSPRWATEGGAVAVADTSLVEVAARHRP